MVPEVGIRGAGFEVDGFQMHHVEGGAVGGDYEGADVAAHGVWEGRQNGWSLFFVVL